MDQRHLWAVLVAVFCAAPALADVVMTNDGVRIEGTIVEETRREVKIRSRRGNVITIPRHSIERISREEPEERFDAQFERLSREEDVDGLLDLAKWARSRKLHPRARQANERVLELDSEQPTARRRLGWRKVEGEWLRGEDMHLALGHVRFEGRWVTGEEYDRIIAGFVKDADGNWVLPADEEPERRPARRRPEPRESKPAKASSPRARAPLPTGAAELLAVVKGSGEPARKVDAMKALAEQGGDAVAALTEELEAQLAKARKKLRDHFKRNKSKVRARLARAIGERRQVALAFIMDPAKYPDANHGAAAQPEVDRLVDHLRRAYQDPLAESLERGDAAGELAAEVRQVAEWLVEHGGSDLDPSGLERAMHDEVRDLIDMTRFPISAADAKVLRHSQGVQAYNDGVSTSLTKEERACVKATNEYRMMFGLKALKVFEPLVQAARKHSEEMVRLGFFEHNSPTPANRTPAQRCQREGASYSGENIAMGMGTGYAAFHAWYTSSGHHRNILARHNSIGIGQHQLHWTQEFGSDDPK
jgi:uncharacterized protein YkwD